MSKPPQERKKATSAPLSDDTPTANFAEDISIQENPASATITVSAVGVSELTDQKQSDKPDGMATLTAYT